MIATASIAAAEHTVQSYSPGGANVHPHLAQGPGSVIFLWHFPKLSDIPTRCQSSLCYYY